MLLRDKVVLVTGLLNRHSIAYGIAKAVQGHGGRLVLTHQEGEQFRRRLLKIADGEFPEATVLGCDLTSDSQIADAVGAAGKEHGRLDGLVHSVAYAPRETLSGAFHEHVDRESFRLANDVSAYSLVALVKEALPLMSGAGGSVVAMSYIGAERAIPNYNLMGVAKACLEANARYLALGAGRHNVRVNVISSGPIRTLASSAIGGIGKMLDTVGRQAPLGRNVGIDDVGDAAAFLLSDLSRAITGETVHVDGGFHLTAMTPEEEGPGEEGKGEGRAG